MDNNDSKIKKVFNSKQFGISLLCGSLAILIGIAIAVSAGRKITDQIELESSVAPTTQEITTRPPVEDVTKEAAAEVTGVPDERTTVHENTEEKYILPLGNQIEKDYSNGAAVKDDTMGDWRCHNGIDFRCKDGDKVKAIKSGAVTASYYNSIWGNVVEIDHGEGIVSRYCGLKEGSTVSVGDILQQGETVGIVTTIPCESKENPHLHFEILIDGKNADPLGVMDKTGE